MRPTRIPSPRNPVGSPRRYRDDPTVAAAAAAAAAAGTPPPAPLTKMPLTVNDALRILGMDTHDTSHSFEARVKFRFKSLALKLHPDRNPHHDTTKQFQSLSAARDLLLAADTVAWEESSSSAAGKAATADTSVARACPRCHQSVQPPMPATRPLFRCPTCDAILRNPYYDPQAAAAAPPDNNNRFPVLSPHKPEAFLREWSPDQQVLLRRQRRAAGDGKRGEAKVVAVRQDGEEVTLDNVVVVWRCRDCPPEQSVCARIAAKSRCVCDHKLCEHLSADGFACSGARGTCLCTRFMFHVAMNGWSCRCRCKHTHREHSPRTLSRPCTKPGCGCAGFHSSWVCNCGHPWSSHETVFHVSRGRRDALRFQREWVCSGVRPELTAEAQAKRKRWVRRGVAPAMASATAHAAVRKAIPKGRSGGGGQQGQLTVKSGGSAMDRRRAYAVSLANKRR